MEKRTFLHKLKAMGPAAIITSAFIGPGTITSSTQSGAQFQYALLWTVVFSGIALIILMDMASRLAAIGHKSVIEATIELRPESRGWRNFVTWFIFLSILFTGLGFEAGNEIGASAGLADIFGLPVWLSALLVGGISLMTVLYSTPKALELIAQGFVVAMGVIFFITMIAVKPAVGEVMGGLAPRVPEGGLMNAMALIGTTLIGLNLVFHSLACQEKYTTEEDLPDSRFDTRFNVIMGVAMTLAIIITSAKVLYSAGIVITSPILFSKTLEPVLGSWARIVGDLGLFLAGLSSTIAVPYITGVIFTRLFHWEQTPWKRKAVGTAILIFGTVLAMLNRSPTEIVIFTQALSGFFLPFLAVIFVIAGNNSKLLGKYANTPVQNVLGALSVLVTLGLGLWTIYSKVILALLA